MRDARDYLDHVLRTLDPWDPPHVVSTLTGTQCDMWWWRQAVRVSVTHDGVCHYHLRYQDDDLHTTDAQQARAWLSDALSQAADDAGA